MIRSMEGFTFASALDINMGYFHIKLDHDACNQKLCTIVFPWNMRKQKYTRLPKDIKIVWILIFFKTSCLSLSKIWNMLRLTFYLNDLLIQTKRTFKDHQLKL
jgi:hypothetical protein